MDAGRPVPTPALGTADPVFPDSIAAIAVAEDGSYTQDYFDSRGVVRVYAMELTDDTWTLVRDAPDFTPLNFSQRFMGKFAPDGDTITAAWETASTGGQVAARLRPNVRAQERRELSSSDAEVGNEPVVVSADVSLAAGSRTKQAWTKPTAVCTVSQHRGAGTSDGRAHELRHVS